MYIPQGGCGVDEDDRTRPVAVSPPATSTRDRGSSRIHGRPGPYVHTTLILLFARGPTLIRTHYTRRRRLFALRVAATGAVVCVTPRSTTSSIGRRTLTTANDANTVELDASVDHATLAWCLAVCTQPRTRARGARRVARGNEGA
ncbi:hypothetical protein BD309DRAFT_963642 [Dichomitus squalens]|nr:hypothetical protein BD309DRAFT_963642 [Dichomitus squalens]